MKSKFLLLTVLTAGLFVALSASALDIQQPFITDATSSISATSTASSTQINFSSTTDDILATTTITEEKKQEDKPTSIFEEILDFLGFSLPQTNGLLGEITSYKPPRLVVTDKKDIKHLVVITKATKIIFSKNIIPVIASTTATSTASTSLSLEIGDTLLIVGKTDKKSVIEAKLIKVLNRKPVATDIKSETSLANQKTESKTATSTSE